MGNGIDGSVLFARISFFLFRFSVFVRMAKSLRRYINCDRNRTMETCRAKRMSKQTVFEALRARRDQIDGFDDDRRERSPHAIDSTANTDTEKAKHQRIGCRKFLIFLERNIASSRARARATHKHSRTLL